MKRVLLLLAGFERDQVLHKAALAAGSVVGVQNALGSSLIERADRLDGCLTRCLDIPTLDLGAGGLDRGTRATDEKAVPDALTLGTANTL